MRLTESKLRRTIRRVILEAQLSSPEEAAVEFLEKEYQMPPDQMKLYPHSYPDHFKDKMVRIYDASAQAGPIEISKQNAIDAGTSLEAIVKVLRDNGSIDQSATEPRLEEAMRLTESKLRRIIRRAILERMGTSVPTEGEINQALDLLQRAFAASNRGQMIKIIPDDVRSFAYTRHMGYPSSITVEDAVIRAGIRPAVIDTRMAGTKDIDNLSRVLEFLGASNRSGM